MRIAVITAYYKEDLETLQRCRDSVANQTHQDVRHIFVSDGHPNNAIDEWDVDHIKLPNHNDYGDTPRLIGSVSAIANEFDALCYLDADNWFEPNHLEMMLLVHEKSECDVITATRNIVRLDGSHMRVDKESDGNLFCDTNCYLICKNAFPTVTSWGFKPKAYAIVGDRYMWTNIRKNFKVAHCNIPTVNYTAGSAVYYTQNTEFPPPNSTVIVAFGDDPTAHTIRYDRYQELLAKKEKMELVDLASDLLNNIIRKRVQ